MIAAQLKPPLTNQTKTLICLISSSHSYSSINSSLKLGFNSNRKYSRLLINYINHNVACKSSQGSFNSRSNDDHHHHDDDYVEAIVLFAETARHYRMLMHGFQEETIWNSAQSVPFSIQGKDPRAHISSVGPGFLRQFLSPTIFLKVSCDGDFLLPIIVGEYAVEKLIEPLHEDEAGESSDQFQLVRNLVERLGYEVEMVKITKRVMNTYFARIIFHKEGEQETLSVDARPSDAINVARRCMAPIFVNKHLILADATRIAYGFGRTGNLSSTYDVILDSAVEGPDILSEELNLVKNMNSAAEEERYHDAAMWREKLRQLHEKHTH
ncbi:hypothetical protein Leryth_012996 [Lithospermum erythrorhizon]|nr:hypothetical protein Leryth_012996 [Lithospermum erythrorhizon]